MFIKRKLENMIDILIKEEKSDDYYILDKENVIIVIKDGDKYKMIHKRLIDNKLIEINSWYLNSYFFGYANSDVCLSNLNLFKVQGKFGKLNSLYDYKTAKFIVSPNTWDYLSFDYMDMYQCFLAHFEIKSTYQEDDILYLTSPITNERVTKSFSVKDSSYYALLNYDGSIRCNKLFKGNSFSQIEEIIDLNNYQSLEDFKKERINICNIRKNKLKEEYYNKINNGTFLYLDKEVERIMKLK
jgi:hypothetical protein